MDESISILVCESHQWIFKLEVFFPFGQFKVKVTNSYELDYVMDPSL